MKVCDVCGRCYENADLACRVGDHPPLSEPHSGSREMIAGYHLDHRLESGVASETYRAHHTATGRTCLVKIYPPNDQYNEQFVAQALQAFAIIHPNVVDVYTAGMLDGGEFFVVEREPAGETLRELLNGTGVPDCVTTIQVVRQVAEALHAIHAKGLVHRAVRPENIFLTGDGEGRPFARIGGIDFCGRFERTVMSDKFLIDSAVDSLKYFAPEQCGAEEVTFKADLYALGVVLYEMLAGRPPFEAPTAAVLIGMHQDQPPPDIHIEELDLRMLLAHTLTESLSKRPDKRQSTALTFARQMRHIEQLATHVSTPPAVHAAAEPPKVAPFDRSAKSAAAASLEARNEPLLAVGPGHSAGDVPETPKLSSAKPASTSLGPHTNVPCELSKDDIPTIEDVLAVLAAEPLPAVPGEPLKMVLTEAETPQDFTDIAARRNPPSLNIVSRRNSSALRAVKPATGDIVPFPDLAEDEKDKATHGGPPTVYAPAPGVQSSRVRVALEIGGGFLALMTIVILSSIIIGTREGPIGASAPSLAGTIIPDQQSSLPRAERRVVAAVPLRKAARVSGRLRAIAYNRSTIAKPRVVSAVYRTRRPARRNMARTSFFPSTLVIYTEGGVVKSKIERQISAVYPKPASFRN